jgi:hypothetical protein
VPVWREPFLVICPSWGIAEQVETGQEMRSAIEYFVKLHRDNVAVGSVKHRNVA